MEINRSVELHYPQYYGPHMQDESGRPNVQVRLRGRSESSCVCMGIMSIIFYYGPSGCISLYVKDLQIRFSIYWWDVIGNLLSTTGYDQLFSKEKEFYDIQQYRYNLNTLNDCTNRGTKSP